VICVTVALRSTGWWWWSNQSALRALQATRELPEAQKLYQSMEDTAENIGKIDAAASLMGAFKV